MTNLERIKAEISEMSAEELRDLLNEPAHIENKGFDCYRISAEMCQRHRFDCKGCQAEWLNMEVENEETDTE